MSSGHSILEQTGGGHAVNIGNASMEAPINQAISSIFLETSASMLVFYLIFRYFAFHTNSPRFRHDWKVKQHTALDIANKSVSALFATTATLIGIYVLTTYGGSFYSDKVITYIMPLAMGYFLYDVVAMYEVYSAKMVEANKVIQNNFKSYLTANPLMAAHHFLLSLFFIPLMINRRDHGPGDLMLACALIMEASTPFVSLRAILHHIHQRQSLLYVINGLVMVAAFFACRILICPWFYQVYGATQGLSMLEAVISTPPRCAFWMLLVLLPQLYWFRIMVSGAIKVVMQKFGTSPVIETHNGNDPFEAKPVVIAKVD